MKKLTCLIIDDEPNAVQLLQDYIAKVPHCTLSASCYDAMEALECLQHTHADLIFLDINMPGLSGIDLINLLPPHQNIVFTTAYSEYAIESYEYNVVDYLLKPISFKRFMMAINKVAPSAQQNDYIFAKSDKKMIRISLSDILYFEGLKEYVRIHTTTEKIIIYKRMKELQDKLPDYFTRIHNSYIVNGNHIARVEGNSVLINNKSLPIGTSYRDPFDTFIRIRTL